MLSLLIGKIKKSLNKRREEAVMPTVHTRACTELGELVKYAFSESAYVSMIILFLNPPIV